MMKSMNYKVVASAATSAPWITMVHGVSQDHRVFNRQVETFWTDYNLLLIDLPGHGISSDVPGPYGMQEYAISISAALADAGVRRSHFWGTHLGAGAGLLLACERPDLFYALVLESPVFPGRPLPTVSNFLKKISNIVRTDGIEAAREVWWHEGGWFDVIRARPQECRAAEHRAIIDSFSGAPWLDSGLVSRPISAIDAPLAELEIPVLLMNGEHDLSDFVKIIDALEKIIPNCQRTVIEEAGGFPLWEFPETVNKVVRSFLHRKSTSFG